MQVELLNQNSNPGLSLENANMISLKLTIGNVKRIYCGIYCGQETVHSGCVLNSNEQIVNHSSIPKPCERKLKCHLNESTETDMSFWEQSSQHKCQRTEEPRNVNLNVTGTFIFCKSHLLKTVSQITKWYLEKWRSNFTAPSQIFFKTLEVKNRGRPQELQEGD